ncbi:hypothetical protein GNF10_26835 [Nostoc sp. UCD121]|uniref:hypothetical protein n=1 Tax=Nostoc sp. UCD121 TaxID=2681305 RepID=UPI001624534B|nr:hypothetical protein [Nostoc sp. UCD121]MBC1222134.1 hypothetical protein [Nostoc sp. UCD120]MBC1279475.1 hypothetical protein [Nostoc sp. UCD121]
MTHSPKSSNVEWKNFSHLASWLPDGLAMKPKIAQESNLIQIAEALYQFNMKLHRKELPG